MTQPAVSSRLLPKRGASLGTTRPIANITAVMRQERDAGLERAEAIDALQELREEEEHREHPADEQHAGQVAPERSRLANSRSGVIGCSARRSVRTKAASSSARRRRTRRCRGRSSRPMPARTKP